LALRQDRAGLGPNLSGQARSCRARNRTASQAEAFPEVFAPGGWRRARPAGVGQATRKRPPSTAVNSPTPWTLTMAARGCGETTAPDFERLLQSSDSAIDDVLGIAVCRARDCPRPGKNARSKHANQGESARHASPGCGQPGPRRPMLASRHEARIGDTAAAPLRPGCGVVGGGSVQLGVLPAAAMSDQARQRAGEALGFRKKRALER